MPAKGNHQPESARQAISAAQKGREWTPEHRANLAASLRGKKRAPRSEETKEKIRAAQIGRKKSPEQIEKNRIAHLGQPSWNKGGTYGEETRQKIREARANQVHPRFAVRAITQQDIDDATAKGLRWCAGDCKAFVPLEQFYKNGNTKRTVCSDCALVVNRVISYKKYGIGQEWYDQTMKEQGGKCALCPVQASARTAEGANGGPRKWRLAVDHDHDTGKVRGLLCTRCNLALHSVEYVEGWAERAVQYLLSSGSQVGKGKMLAPDGTPIKR